MKNVITAMGNPKINEELKKGKIYNVLLPDIQYQEGVIEVLEGEMSIDVLILNSILPGEKTVEELINLIKGINRRVEIIIILEKENDDIKNFLISKGVFNVFYDNQITIEEIKQILKENKIPNEINEEIKLLKEMILDRKRKTFFDVFQGEKFKKGKVKHNQKNETVKTIKGWIKKNKAINYYLLNNKIIKELRNKKNKINNQKNKVISIIGMTGAGKTLIIYMLAKIIKNKKILIIDFDFSNNNMSTLFGTSKLPENTTKLLEENKLKINHLNASNLIIHISKQLKLVSRMNLILEKHQDTQDLKDIIKEMMPKYDLIIIDTSSETSQSYLKQIINISNSVFFVVVPNILGIKSSQKLLEVYINKWKIRKEKINIIFNKYNINSIDNTVLENLFSEFKILGKIKMRNIYDLFLNGNKPIISHNIKKEYLSIISEAYPSEKDKVCY
ncbi:MAG: AAA family ATPase [Oscillospiraceae bacterium]|nr:AAA family ATPase [Oscillospiraceae bacterium]